MEMYDSSIVKLDEEFRAGLQNIRAYLMNLTSPQAARCCGEWLQKLSNCPDERELRNVLLKRLTSQVQKRQLEYPFDRLPPPDTQLYKIYEEVDMSSWCTDYESSTKDTIPTSLEDCQSGDEKSNRKEAGVMWYDMPRRGRGDTTQHQRVPSPTEDIPRKYNGVLAGHQPPSQQHYNRSGVYNPNLQHEVLLQRHVETKLQATKDDGKKTRLYNEIKPHKKHHDRNTTGHVQDQVVNSKSAKQVDELTSYLEDYKTLLSDYKKVVNENITDLAERLETAIENNQVQKSDLKNLQSSLQESWTVKLETLEKELVAEVNKLQHQLETDRNKYEVKIEQLKQVILDKDDKINSLDSKMKLQSVSLKEKMNRVKNEVNNASKESDLQYKKKYSFLKKQLLEMEKINKELVKQYEQNIKMTVKDYECKVNSAKLLASSESMTEMEDKIRLLEQVYQKIFHEYKIKMQEDKSKESKRLHKFEEVNSCNRIN